MRKPFKLLKEAAHEATETFGVVLDEQFSIHDMRYEFEKFVFVIQQDSVPEGKEPIKLTLEISGDVLDEHFDGLP